MTDASRYKCSTDNKITGKILYEFSQYIGYSMSKHKDFLKKYLPIDNMYKNLKSLFGDNFLTYISNHLSSCDQCKLVYNTICAETTDFDKYFCDKDSRFNGITLALFADRVQRLAGVEKELAAIFGESFDSIIKKHFKTCLSCNNKYLEFIKTKSS
ncbi:MAG: hypothetical protein AABW52_04880 [Nanoarchaeota archaeon]